MYINRIRTGYATALPEISDKTRRGGATRGSSGAGEVRGDQVELSGAAKALAKEYAATGLTPERIQHLRQQIERGVYNQPEVVEELAWRLIEAGVI